MINRVVLVGRLTKEIEVKKTNSDKSFCRFTVACDRRDKTADFISCVAWNQSADFLGQYSHKGDVVAVDGHITTGSYDSQRGKVYTTDVVADTVRLISKREEKAPEVAKDEYEEVTEYDRQQTALDGLGDMNDLPFY